MADIGTRLLGIPLSRTSTPNNPLSFVNYLVSGILLQQQRTDGDTLKALEGPLVTLPSLFNNPTPSALVRHCKEIA